MKGIRSIFVIVAMLTVAFVALVFLTYPLKITQESKAATTSSFDAQQLSNKDMIIVKGNKEGKPSTDEVMYYPDSKTDHDFVPCTEEQKKLELGDRVTFKHSAEALGESEDPVGKIFCHLKISRLN